MKNSFLFYDQFWGECESGIMLHKGLVLNIYVGMDKLKSIWISMCSSFLFIIM